MLMSFTFIGRGIAATMAKLEKLAVLAKRKTLFDDKPTEINQLTFVIKQGTSTLSLSQPDASPFCICRHVALTAHSPRLIVIKSADFRTPVSFAPATPERSRPGRRAQ